MNEDDIKKALELIGKEVYAIENPFDGRPYAPLGANGRSGENFKC